MNRVASLLLFSLVFGGLLASCGTAPIDEPDTAPADMQVLSDDALASSRGRIDFVTHVRPVLEAKCITCHQLDVLPFFSMENRALAFGSVKSGRRIVPGKPEESLLIMHAHASKPGMKEMPPVGNRLTPDEKRILSAWIAQGAEWPAGKAGQLDPEAGNRD